MKKHWHKVLPGLDLLTTHSVGNLGRGTLKLFSGSIGKANVENYPVHAKSREPRDSKFERIENHALLQQHVQIDERSHLEL